MTGMRVEFLGTGPSLGIPVVGCKCPVCRSSDVRDKRLRSSVMVAVGKQHILIDAGPDLRQQMLSTRNVCIDAVLLTHLHKDHIGGLDDLRPFNYMQQKPINVYGEPLVCKAIRNEFYYVFEENPYPGVPQLSLIEIDLNPFYIAETEIIPIRGLHGKLPVLGFRIGDFAYLTDMSFISEKEKEKLCGIHTLVINALRNTPHISHFCTAEALSVIEDLCPQVAFLTHLSHEAGLHAEQEQLLPDNVRIACDNLSLDIPC